MCLECPYTKNKLLKNRLDVLHGNSKNLRVLPAQHIFGPHSLAHGPSLGPSARWEESHSHLLLLQSGQGKDELVQPPSGFNLWLLPSAACSLTCPFIWEVKLGLRLMGEQEKGRAERKVGVPLTLVGQGPGSNCSMYRLSLPLTFSPKSDPCSLVPGAPSTDHLKDLQGEIQLTAHLTVGKKL